MDLAIGAPPARPERPERDLSAGLSAPPDPPELPDPAGEPPRWPAWYAPVALLSSFVLIALTILPIIPWALLTESSIETVDTADATFLLIGIVVQDGAWVTTALLFGLFKQRPRGWQFGLRPARLWPAVGWSVLALALLYAFEFGYLELLAGDDDSNVDDLGADAGLLAAIAVSLAIIVVAPITEEFFFRGFFYRALRNRMRRWLAAPIDGVVFGALHFEGYSTAITLPVIALFGFAMCLVYERTQTLFSVIAIHAAFNCVAVALSGGNVAVAVTIGLLVIAGCVIVPWRMRARPSPWRGVRAGRSRVARVA